MDAASNVLRADLLGRVRFRWGGAVVAPRSRKGAALLVALSLHGTALTRGELADLLWAPGRVQSVRQALHALRALPGAAHWLEAGASVALRVDVDVARFVRSVQARSYAEALALWTEAEGTPVWRDDLWREVEQGVTTAFTDFLEVERERLRGVYLTCLQGRAAELERAGEVTAAARVVDALLASDALNETAYRSAMRLAVARGEVHEALAVFERCRQVLDAELGVPPVAETVALAREIEATLPQVLRAPRRRLPLPAHATPFVGRAHELEALEALVRSDGTRLITLVGAGGVGKTSLAIEVAVRCATAFVDGVAFVPLAGLAHPDDVPSSVAQALDLPLADGARVEDVVVDALRDAHALVVVDNVEHVVAGAGVLGAIAAACPRVRVLATSREVLDVPGETVVGVAGLSLPSPPVVDGRAAAGPPSGDARGDAVALFVEAARRVDAAFVWDDDAAPEVERIVRGVEGVPLAIVLAATWVRHRPLAELAEAVSVATHALETDDDDLPTRHRSLRAAFDHSWQLLADDERRLLASLAVCRGGFERDAAEAIADARLRGLLALVNKSLLTRDPVGRFGMLETIRASALAALDAGDAPDAHARHYLGWLATLHAALAGPSQREAQRRVSVELDNVRAAIEHAIRGGDAELLDAALDAYDAVVHLRGLFREGARTYAAAIEALGRGGRAQARTVARLRVRRSGCLARTSDFDEALAEAQRGAADLARDADARERGVAASVLGFALYLRDRSDEAYAAYAAAADAFTEAGDERGRSVAYHGIGKVHFGTGRDAEAEEAYRSALAAARAADDPGMIARALGGLGICAATRGELDEAIPRFEEAARLLRAADDRRALAASLNNLARAQQLAGRVDASIVSLRECIDLRREVGDRFGLGLGLANLGAAQRDADPEAAESTLRSALDVFRRIDNRSGTILTLNRLGDLLAERGQDTQAFGCHDEALALALGNGETPQALEALVGLGALAGRRGRHLDALTVLAWVRAHPQQDYGGAEAARRRIEDLAAGLPEGAVETAARRAGASSQEAIVTLARDAATAVD